MHKFKLRKHRDGFKSSVRITLNEQEMNYENTTCVNRCDNSHHTRCSSNETLIETVFHIHACVCRPRKLSCNKGHLHFTNPLCVKTLEQGETEGAHETRSQGACAHQHGLLTATPNSALFLFVLYFSLHSLLSSMD